MSELSKIWFLRLIEDEIKEVTGAISNESIWIHGSENEEQVQMHTENLASLEEYKNMLQGIKEKVMEGELLV